MLAGEEEEEEAQNRREAAPKIDDVDAMRGVVLTEERRRSILEYNVLFSVY